MTICSKCSKEFDYADELIIYGAQFKIVNEDGTSEPVCFNCVYIDKEDDKVFFKKEDEKV